MSMAPARAATVESGKRRKRDVLLALPEPRISMSQDNEWCVIQDNGKWRKIRFHDYHELYEIPGLYERIFYKILRCDSPRRVRNLFEAELNASGSNPEELRVLDLGAGNGMVAEQMVDMGAQFAVGVDIVEEAAAAARRDRPDVYDDYVVADISQLDDRTLTQLRQCRFNTMTCVAALGFGDIPTAAFTAAFNLVRRGGWIAFNIKEEFLNGQDSSGFAGLIRSITGDGTMDVLRKERYRHRIGTDRRPLHYVAIVGRKNDDIR